MDVCAVGAFFVGLATAAHVRLRLRTMPVSRSAALVRVGTRMKDTPSPRPVGSPTPITSRRPSSRNALITFLDTRHGASLTSSSSCGDPRRVKTRPVWAGTQGGRAGHVRHGHRRARYRGRRWRHSRGQADAAAPPASPRMHTPTTTVVSSLTHQQRPGCRAGPYLLGGDELGHVGLGGQRRGCVKAPVLAEVPAPHLDCAHRLRHTASHPPPPQH
jgi:hypothetical protein